MSSAVDIEAKNQAGTWTRCELLGTCGAPAKPVSEPAIPIVSAAGRE
jgi:hypothetical protein